MSTNLELFNLHWKTLKQYQQDKDSLLIFSKMLIRNNLDLLEFGYKIVSFLQKIDFCEADHSDKNIKKLIRNIFRGDCWRQVSKNYDIPLLKSKLSTYNKI